MRTPPRSEREPRSGVVTPARIFSRVDLPEPLGPTRPAWSPSNNPNDRSSKSDRVPYAMLIASQLSRSGRLIRCYFFFFFGFFFSFRMPVPFAMGSPPLVNGLAMIIDTDAGGANQFLHVDGRQGPRVATAGSGRRSLALTPPRLGGGLSDGRTVALERRAAHVARLVDRERPGAVHGLAVVPHHQVADPPLGGVDEIPLGRMLDQVAQEQARLPPRPAQERARGPGQVGGLAPGTGGDAPPAPA